MLVGLWRIGALGVLGEEAHARSEVFAANPRVKQSSYWRLFGEGCTVQRPGLLDCRRECAKEALYRWFKTCVNWHVTGDACLL